MLKLDLRAARVIGVLLKGLDANALLKGTMPASSKRKEEIVKTLKADALRTDGGEWADCVESIYLSTDLAKLPLDGATAAWLAG